MRDRIWAIYCVWSRYFASFRKTLAYSLVTTISEPILYLTAFGFGFGALVGEVVVHGETIPYRRFVLAGIVAQTVLFNGFFEAAYGSFIRMYYQKIFHAMATTPILLSEILWGELLWDATRATIGALAVLGVGVIIGDFSVMGALMAVPVCFLGGLIFGGFGLWVSSFSRTIDGIAYPQNLVIYPMFLFGGVFFPIDHFPEPIQMTVFFLPLTGILWTIRYLVVGIPFNGWVLLPTAFWLILLVTLSRSSMARRIVK